MTGTHQISIKKQARKTIDSSNIHESLRRGHTAKCIQIPSLREGISIHLEQNMGKIHPSYVIILVHKVDIPGSALVVGHKVTITRWPLVPGISCQHALQTHADTLDCLDGGPAWATQEVQTDDAVAVDVWVHGDRTGCVGGGRELHELDLWGL